MITHEEVYIFEQRNGKQYYSKCLKSLCRTVRSLDGWFNEPGYVFLRAKKKVDCGVFCDTHHVDMSQVVR